MFAYEQVHLFLHKTVLQLLVEKALNQRCYCSDVQTLFDKPVLVSPKRQMMCQKAT